MIRYLLLLLCFCSFALAQKTNKETVEWTQKRALLHRAENNTIQPLNYYGTVYARPLKTSLHLHSTTSDGRYTPQQVVDLYATAGYDVIQLSDHSKTNSVSELDGQGMILLSGMEMHPKHARGNTWHLLAVNIPEDFPVQDDKTPQEAIDAVLAAGGFVFVAHPNWSGFDAADIRELKGISGIEIFNADCNNIGKGYSIQLWEEMLDRTLAKSPYPFGIAVDDMHHGYRNNHPDSFHGWIMLLAKDKSKEAVLEALRERRWYATQGPQFNRLELKGDVFEAEFTPCVKAHVIGVKFNSKGFYSDPFNPKPFTSVRFDMSGIRKAWKSLDWQYVRIQITDDCGRTAWSNPISMRDTEKIDTTNKPTPDMPQPTILKPLDAMISTSSGK